MKTEITCKQKILLVDDEPAVLSVLRDMLECKGYECVLASDGDEALRLAHECSPALIVSDVYMPTKNGLELLKELPEFLPKTEFIAISGYANESTRQKIELLGAFKFMSKPIGMKDFLSAVEQGLKSNRLRRLRLEPSKGQSARKKGRVLVVGENKASCDFIKTVLEKDNYFVDVASDAGGADERAHENSYNVAFFDLNSAGKKVIQALRVIRQSFPDILTVATVNSMTNDAYAIALSIGVSSIITKPLDEELLKKKMLKLTVAAQRKKFSPPQERRVPKPRRHKRKAIVMWLVVVLGIVAGLIALYFFLNRNR